MGIQWLWIFVCLLISVLAFLSGRGSMRWVVEALRTSESESERLVKALGQTRGQLKELDGKYSVEVEFRGIFISYPHAYQTIQALAVRLHELCQRQNNFLGTTEAFATLREDIATTKKQLWRAVDLGRWVGYGFPEEKYADFLPSSNR